jgi:hypothetical protein
MRPGLIPSERQMYAWIEEIFGHGIRRPGFAADRWAEGWALDHFRRFGLINVRAEPVEMPYWEPRGASLIVRSSAGPSRTLDVPCFPLPFSSTTPGIEADLVAFDESAPERVRGAVSLCGVRLSELPHTVMARMSTWPYDPDHTFANARHLLPFGPGAQAVMEPSIDAGALAFVGTLTGYPGDSRSYYVPYDGKLRSIPGVWISGSDGARVRALLAEGSARARVQLDAVCETITCYNIVGELPGADDETVIVGSHHDGPWASAVEDSSGISLVLAQAAYWSRVPRTERPHRLVFLLNSGHMAGGAGQAAFVRTHRAELDHCVLEVHLEHVANEFAEVDGKLGPTGEPEVRWWFTSRIGRLEDTVRSAIQAEDLRRSYIVPPTIFGEKPTTDGADFHVAGVPLVHFLTAPFYLFDVMDTLDKIHRPSLVPVTRAAIRIIASTAAITAAGMRADYPAPPVKTPAP